MPEEASEIEALVRASFHAAYATTAEVVEGTRDLEAKVAGVRRDLLAPHMRAFVARGDASEGHPLLGAVLVRALPDGRLFVDDLFVRQDARRRGVARALLAAALPEGAEVGCEVNARNEAALRFFEGRGFRRAVETVVLVRPPGGGSA